MSSQNQEHLPALIHGHTHRPAVHEHLCHGVPFKRYVIQDWADDKGGYLAIDETGVHVHELKL